MYSCIFKNFMHSIIIVQEEKQQKTKSKSIIHHGKDPGCLQNRPGASGSSGNSLDSSSACPRPAHCLQTQFIISRTSSTSLSGPSSRAVALNLALTQMTIWFLGLPSPMDFILLTFPSFSSSPPGQSWLIQPNGGIQTFPSDV